MAIAPQGLSQELNTNYVIASIKRMFSDEYPTFGPVTHWDEWKVRNLLHNFDVENCPEEYFKRMARKCKSGEVAFLARLIHGEMKLVKDQRTLSYSIHCDVPGRGRCSILEYRDADGVLVLRKYPTPSETFVLDETDITRVLARALAEEQGIQVQPEHLTEEYLVPFEGPLRLMEDVLEGSIEEDFHDVPWSSNFFVRNRIYRCGWRMPYLPQYFRPEGYTDKETGNRFLWHGENGKLITF